MPKEGKAKVKSKGRAKVKIKVKAADNFSILELLKFGWDRTKAQVTTLILLMIGVMLVSLLGRWFISQLSQNLPFLKPLFSLVWIVVLLLLSMGLIKSILQINRGQKVSVDSFKFPLKQVLNFVGGSVLVGLITFVGFVALIIPGLYFALRYTYVNFLIVDQNMSFSDAMNRSSELTQGIKFKLLGFILVLALLNVVAGVLFFGLGLLLTIPVTYLAQAKLYDVLQKNK